MAYERFQRRVLSPNQSLQVTTNKDKIMKLLASQSYRPIRLTIAASFGMLLSLLALPCLAQQDTANVPFDVLNEPINKLRIYNYLEKNAKLQKESQAEGVVDHLSQQLKDAITSSDVSLDSLINQPLADPNDLYPHMVKSCLYLGQFYDCGRCDRSHVTMSCGVVIDESGLALTNHHVMRLQTSKGTTEGFMAMTYDGKCFEVEEILASDVIADIALVKLKANGHKFHAAPIAKTRPQPTSEVRMVSHPTGEFFVMTKGEVSRYSRTPKKKATDTRTPTWLEITAAFGGGSSGAGVFNSAGEVVGIASRIRPITRPAKKATYNGKTVSQPVYVELILRRCVDLAGIKACFKSDDSKAPMKAESKDEPATVKADDSDNSDTNPQGSSSTGSTTKVQPTK